MGEHCGGAVVVVRVANGLAVHVRAVKKGYSEVPTWARRARQQDGYAASLSRHGEAECVTNPPIRWDEDQRHTGAEAADLLMLHWAVETGPR